MENLHLGKCTTFLKDGGMENFLVNESNGVSEDLEIVTKCLREDFGLRPEEDGARIIGNVTLEERNRRGDWMRINCRDDVGDSGYGFRM